MERSNVPQFFFKTEEDKQVVNRLKTLLEFNMVDKEIHDGMMELWFGGQPLDQQLVTAFIDGRVNEGIQKLSKEN